MNKPDANATKEEINKLIDKRAFDVVKKFSESTGFTVSKITDTPTDALHVVNKKFVTANGSVASRISSSVATVGRFYLDTNTNIPMWKVTAGWVNGVGSIVALNN